MMAATGRRRPLQVTSLGLGLAMLLAACTRPATAPRTRPDSGTGSHVAGAE
jgi:hypothetical protein